jgi:hypothetical protein
MQCPNCRFENMPGNVSCTRCGSSLQLASASFSVEPPRAPRWAKRIRPWIPWPSYYYQRRDIVAWWRTASWLTKQDSPLLSSNSIWSWLRMLIPGWAHRYEGAAARGNWLFFTWLPLAILTIWTYGTSFGDVALLLLLCVHAAAILDLVWPDEFWERCRLALFAGAAVVLLFWISARVPWIVGELRIGH